MTRGSRLVALLGVVALTVAGCGLFSSKPSAQDVANGFLSAYARGDVASASNATDTPAAAKSLLTSVRAALKPTSVAASVDKVDAADSSATVTFTMTWELGANRSWRYQGSLDEIKDSDGWKVRWAPSVIHPKLAAQQTVAVREQDPELAPVLDRDGVALLAPTTVISVVLDRKQAGNLAAVAGTLAGAVGRFDNTVTAAAIVAGANRTPDGQGYPVISLRDSDYQQVKAQIHDLPGVRFGSQERLLAPNKTFGAQVLPAITKAVNAEVAGDAGFRVVTLDATGNEVNELYDKPAQPAKAVTATLSTKVQQAAESAVAPLTQPSIIVAVQPSTGELLAVAQNQPADAQGALALTGRYPPGSTFKIATATAALEAGTVTADTPRPCPGTTTIAGRVIPNEDEFDKGVIPLHSAFAFSCNTTFAQLAVGLPDDALSKAAKQLGIGLDYVIPGLTTVTGTITPSTSTVERAEDGFGQGKDVVTPFGMAMVAATVAHGSVPVPSLLRGVRTTVTGTAPAIPQPVLNSVRSMMREVVSGGTARQLASMTDLVGKTGTAQFGDGTHSHGWFVGYRGDLAFAVLLVGADSSTPAVNVAGTFLRAAA